MKNIKINRLITTFGSLSLLIVIGKILGLIKQMVTAGIFGATLETDMISLADGLIANAEYVISNTLVTAFVAVYLHLKVKDIKKGDQLVSDAVKIFALVAVVLVFIIMISADGISKIIAPSYSVEQSGILATYLRILAPVLLLFTLDSLFNALLNANQKFIPGQMRSTNQSIIVIVVIICMSGFIGVRAILTGFIMYSLYNFCFLGFCSRKYWRIKKGNPFKNSNIKELFSLIWPLLIAYSMIFINQMIDKIIVSGMEDGTVTALSYGAVLSNLVITFIGTFCNVLYTRMASSSAKGEAEAVGRTVNDAVVILTTLFLPITIITFVCSDDIISIVYGRGAFDSTAIASSSFALKGYCFCFVPTVVKELFIKAQYSDKNTKGPTLNTTIGIIVNITLSIVLSRFFGVFGVAFASSVAEVICALLNIFSAKRNNRAIDLHRFLDKLPLWGIGSLICIAISCFGNNILSVFAPFIRFLLITIVCFVLYGSVMIFSMKDNMKHLFFDDSGSK